MFGKISLLRSCCLKLLIVVFLSDVDELNTQSLAEILPVLSSDVVRECTVVSTTQRGSGAPAPNLEGWLWNPRELKLCPGSFRHCLWLDALYLTCDETETVAEVNYCCLNTLTCLQM